MIYLLSVAFGVLAVCATQPQRQTWLGRICSLLVADDPAPYAEFSSEDLLEWYRNGRRDRDKILKELVFRLRAGMLDASEEAEFRVIMKEKQNARAL